MDWFKGKLKPETPIFHGKNHGFRLIFSQQNQTIETCLTEPFTPIDRHLGSLGLLVRVLP